MAPELGGLDFCGNEADINFPYPILRNSANAFYFEHMEAELGASRHKDRSHLRGLHFNESDQDTVFHSTNNMTR